MWKKVLDSIRYVLTLSQKVQSQQETIKKLQDDLERTQAATVEVLFEAQRMRDEIEHMRKDQAREYENLVLRLENEMLKFERRLNSPKSED